MIHHPLAQFQRAYEYGRIRGPKYALIVGSPNLRCKYSGLRPYRDLKTPGDRGCLHFSTIVTGLVSGPTLRIYTVWRIWLHAARTIQYAGSIFRPGTLSSERNLKGQIQPTERLLHMLYNVKTDILEVFSGSHGANPNQLYSLTAARLWRYFSSEWTDFFGYSLNEPILPTYR